MIIENLLKKDISLIGRSKKGTIMIKKEFDILLKQYGAEELGASLVFPKPKPGKPDKKTGNILLEELTKRRSNLLTEDQLKAQIMQLRFQIEDYLKENRFNRKKTFGYFLKSYITILDRKSNEFADEIDINPTELSQYINNHRTPPQPVMIRLELHSQNIIPAIHWYRLAESRKLHELMSDKSLRREQKKFVKF
jgi:plasmid maintenance system antidote protein VapI